MFCMSPKNMAGELWLSI